VKRRVVITGIGLVTPVGNDKESTWENLIAGKSGVSYISRFDTEKHRAKVAAEVHNFPAEKFLTVKECKHLELFVQYGIAAADMALKDASLEIADDEAHRAGVITGVGMGGVPTIENYHGILLKKGPRRISPFFIPMVIPNMVSGHISMRANTKGPNLALSTACAAGTHAVGEAFHKIAYGSCDIMITGGAESVICPIVIGGFSAAKALTTQKSNPEAASKPFDRDRDGFIISEGAGMLILEELEHALTRKADIYAEIVGYGLTSDSYHITAPPADGEGAARCMAMALSDAQMNPDDVDYINAHGTSTPLNDRCETAAIKSVFKDYAYKMNISSTKSMIGHMLGGAGGVEAAFTALTLKHGIVPPTINYNNPDPDCDLDYVPNIAREIPVRAALSNTFGFGGTNAVVAMKRFDG
jgi:3-oxoacyl-[acyl-carrier-protein] synthase II